MDSLHPLIALKKVMYVAMQKLVLIKRKFLSGYRNWVQLSIFVMTIAMGFQFYLYASQAAGDGPISIYKPMGVEGFLPIGALMGWKYFFSTGIWEGTHPASMVFLGFAVLISVIFKKSFCGWFCPVGTLSEWVWKIGELKLGKNYKMYPWLDLPLRSLKYLLLGFFLYIITRMSSADIATFFENPYYKIADLKMLYFFTKISFFTLVVLFVLIVLSFFFKNFWCRYACPYGALLGVFSLLSLTRIHRDTKKCTDCGQCEKVCPYHLPVNTKEHIFSPECCACMDCVNICPSKNTLAIKTIIPKKTITTSQMGLGIIMIFLSIVYFAGITGHWKSNLSDGDFRKWLKISESSEVQHPSVKFKSR